MTTSLEAKPVETHLTPSEQAEKWVAVARSIAPLVESEQAQGAEDRIVTRKVVQAWRDAGLYSLVVPRHFGGQGLDTATYLEVAEEISRQDASAGWVYGIHTVGSLFPGILLPESSYRDIVGPDADKVTCGFAFGKVPGTAKPVDGGYLVQSEPMPWGSGTQHADRVASALYLLDRDGAQVIGDDGNPVTVNSYIDPENIEWLHNWDPAGLQGTGSGHYFIKEHVLEEKWLSLATGDRSTDPIFGQGFFAAVHMHHAGVGLGIAKRALEELAKSTSGRRRGDIAAVDQNPVFQTDFVRMDAEYRSARALVMDAYREIYDAAAEGRATDLHTARVQQADFHLYRVLKDIVSTASVWAGSDAVARTSVFARLNADTAIAANHLVLSPHQALGIAPLIFGDALAESSSQA